MPLTVGRPAGAAIYPRKLCEAVSRGLLKQKAFDNMISTGNMDRSRAASFLQAVSRGSNRRVQVSNPCMRADGKIRPVGNRPEKWCDGVHEEDGGDDERGVLRLNGTKTLEEQMSGLAKRGGEEVAWDDVTDVGLDPKEVRAAR